MAKYILFAYHQRKFRESAVVLKISPQGTSELIKVEQLIMFLHGLLLNTQWRKWTGGEPYMSYEIVGRHKKIEFYVWITRRYKKALEEQIYLCYPDCVVEQVEDFIVPLKLYKKITKDLKVKKKHGEFEGVVKRLKIQGMSLRLGLSYVFPSAYNTDIIDAILGTMTDMEWHEKMIVQILLKPVDRTWQIKGRGIIKDYEKKGRHPGAKGGIFDDFADEIDELRGQFFNELEGRKSSLPKRRVLEHTRADREEIREAAKKVLKSGFEVEIRILGTGFYGRGLKDRVRAAASAFNKLDAINRMRKSLIYFKGFFYRKVQTRYMPLLPKYNIMTPGELSGFFLRLPDKGLSIKELQRNRLIQLPPPTMGFEKKQNLLGNIMYKGSRIPFGLKPQDARRHIHVIGGIGVGKSEFLKRQFLDAAMAGKGAILLDPHGELSEDILVLLAQMLSEERLEDVLFYDFSDSEFPIPFNFMKIHFDKGSGMSRGDVIDETAEEFMNIMKQIFSDSWGIRTEKIFRHVGKALMEAGDGSLWNAKQMLKNRQYRKQVVKKVRNVAVRDFWETEFVEKQQSNGTYKLDSEMKNAIDSPLTKIDRFLSSERILNMVAQEECIHFRECINGKKIVIFKIPKGVLKEENTKFIGNIVFSKLMMAFMARLPEEMKHETLVLADEVQNFVTTNPKSFETLLDELRKYGVQFVMAHQRVSQIEPIISAVMDNVGTTVCFRVGVESSKYMQRVFDKFLTSSDLEQLENRYAYCKALVDGQKTDPFLIKTLDRYEADREAAQENIAAILEMNRSKRRPKAEVEQELKQRLKQADESDSEFKTEVDEDFIKEMTARSPNPVNMGMPAEWE